MPFHGLEAQCGMFGKLDSAQATEFLKWTSGVTSGESQSPGRVRIKSLLQ
jgi:hypothetical protein